MKKNPARTEATRQKMFDAFWKICQTKAISKITIGDITKTAGYNRGTFYEYFTDIFDLQDQLEEQLLKNIQTDTLALFADGLPEQLDEYSVKCAGVFRKYDDRIFRLLGPSGDPKFIGKLQKVFLEDFSVLFHMTLDIPNADYVITFLYSAMLGLLTHWYESEKDLPEEKFLNLLQRLLADGAAGYLKLPLFSA